MKRGLYQIIETGDVIEHASNSWGNYSVICWGNGYDLINSIIFAKEYPDWAVILRDKNFTRDNITLISIYAITIGIA